MITRPITDTPQAGLFRTKLVSGGPPVAVRIWYGLPVIDGEQQDRAPQWCIEIDGHTDRLERDDDTGYRCRVPLDVYSVWPIDDEIDQTEYRFLLRRRDWAHEHATDHPAANPRRRVDVGTLKPAF